MTIDPAASGPDTHLDPDRMADLYDGLLAPGSAEAAQRHLASCRVCADDFALITMESPLGDVLPPEPIPMEVAIRIEAALHREPPLTAPSAAPQHAAAPRRRSRRFRVVFGSLAGATVVIAGAVAGISALSSGAGGRNASTASGAQSMSRDSAAPSAEAPSAAPSSSKAMAPGAAAMSVEEQARQLLANSGPNQSLANGSTDGTKTQTSRIVCPPRGFENTSPLGMTAITYEGQSAELLVYAKPGDNTTAEVYVVATAGCTSSRPGDVLYSTEVPRP